MASSSADIEGSEAWKVATRPAFSGRPAGARPRACSNIASLGLSVGRPVARARGLDGRAEGRTGEQDAAAAGAGGVAGQGEEALDHRRGELAVAGEVHRQAVVEEVHAHGLRPVALEGGLDRLHGQGRGVAD